MVNRVTSLQLYSNTCLICWDNGMESNDNVHGNNKVDMVDRDNDERKKILDSVDTKTLFDKTESAIIEWNIDNIVKEAKEGKFKRYTVDRAPLR